MTAEDNKARDSHTSEPVLRVLKARWEVPSEGSDDPKRQALIDLAFRVAGIAQPGFAPPRTRQAISSKYEVDDMSGGSSQEEVYRLGDTERGVEITDRYFNPNDGIVGISGWTGVNVYGLPEGWDISVDGDFVAAQYGRPQPMSLTAKLPDEAINSVANILKTELGATVEGS